MREIIVVRHGESVGNVAGIAQGREDYPLTERGVKQARAAAQLVRDHGWTPQEIVTSPVARCVDTAALVQEFLEMPRARTDAAFTEIDCGEATGLAFSEIEQKWPEATARLARRWLGFESFGGESNEDVLQRVADGVDALPEEGRILLVTHGAVFKGVLARLLDFPTTFYLELRNGTCMRLERKTLGEAEVMAFTHHVHPDERD